MSVPPTPSAATSRRFFLHTQKSDRSNRHQGQQRSRRSNSGGGEAGERRSQQSRHSHIIVARQQMRCDRRAVKWMDGGRGPVGSDPPNERASPVRRSPSGALDSCGCLSPLSPLCAWCSYIALSTSMMADAADSVGCECDAQTSGWVRSNPNENAFTVVQSFVGWCIGSHFATHTSRCIRMALSFGPCLWCCYCRMRDRVVGSLGPKVPQRSRAGAMQSVPFRSATEPLLHPSIRPDARSLAHHSATRSHCLCQPSPPPPLPPPPPASRRSPFWFVLFLRFHQESSSVPFPSRPLPSRPSSRARDHSPNNRRRRHAHTPLSSPPPPSTASRHGRLARAAACAWQRRRQRGESVGDGPSRSAAHADATCARRLLTPLHSHT